MATVANRKIWIIKVRNPLAGQVSVQPYTSMNRTLLIVVSYQIRGSLEHITSNFELFRYPVVFDPSLRSGSLAIQRLRSKSVIEASWQARDTIVIYDRETESSLTRRRERSNFERMVIASLSVSQSSYNTHSFVKG